MGTPDGEFAFNDEDTDGTAEQSKAKINYDPAE